MAAFTFSRGQGRGMGQVALPKVHWEALTAETLQASRRVGGLHFIDEFYLARGTGSALHHGHRFSMDLDFFSAASEAEEQGLAPNCGVLEKTRHRGQR
jgi:hypothetical protein